MTQSHDILLEWRSRTTWLIDSFVSSLYRITFSYIPSCLWNINFNEIQSFSLPGSESCPPWSLGLQHLVLTLCEISNFYVSVGILSSVYRLYIFSLFHVASDLFTASTVNTSSNQHLACLTTCLKTVSLTPSHMIAHY